MVTPLKVHGADQSHHNENPFLKKAKVAGLGWYFHKVSEGATVLDARYSDRRQAAAEAKVPFGGYHFAHPEKGDAAKEANFFLTHAKIKPGDLCPMLDLEVNKAGLNQDELTTWVGQWVAVIRKKLGVLPIIYTPFNLKKDFGCVLWVPRYNNDNRPPVTPTPWKRWDIWQFSNGELGVPSSFPGLPGNVDLNHCREGFRLSDITIPVKPPVAETKDHTGIFRITTQNVKALPLMIQSKVVEDVELTAKESGIVCWQEIGPDRYQAAVKNLDQTKWTHFFGGAGKLPQGYESPISYRKEYWSKVDGGRFQFIDGEAGICGNKYVTWLVLKHKKTGALLYVDSAHYVASAWNKEHMDTKKKRQELWLGGYQVHMAHVKEIIAKYPEAALALCGDYNATWARDAEHFQKTVAKRQIQVTVGERSIDHIFLINGTKWKWNDKTPELMPGRNSDHQGRRVSARLVAA